MRPAAIVFALIGLPHLALAHLVPPGQALLRVDADGVFMIATLPVTALREFDDDHDGLMSLPELGAHRAQLLSQSEALLATRGLSEAGRITFQDLIFPHADDRSTPPATHLVLMRRTRFAAAREGFTVEAGGAIGTVQLTAVEGDRRELRTTDPKNGPVSFFTPTDGWLRRSWQRLSALLGP